MAAGEKSDTPGRKVEEAENTSKQGARQAGEASHKCWCTGNTGGAGETPVCFVVGLRAGCFTAEPGIERIRVEVCSMTARQWQRRRQRRPLARVQRAGAGAREAPWKCRLGKRRHSNPKSCQVTAVLLQQSAFQTRFQREV